MTIAGIAFLVAGVALALEPPGWIAALRSLAAVVLSLGAVFLARRHGLAPGLTFAIATLTAAVASRRRPPIHPAGDAARRRFRRCDRLLLDFLKSGRWDSANASPGGGAG